MSMTGVLQVAITLLLVFAAAVPLGGYILRVMEGERVALSRAGAPVERLFYRLAGVDPTREQSWFLYTMSMLAFSLVGFLSLYALQRLQNHAAAKSPGLRRRGARSRLQHLAQLHHQHQLAELQRRDDDESSHANAGADRP